MLKISEFILKVLEGNIPRKRKKSKHCLGSKGREAGIFLWLIDEVVCEEEIELQQLHLRRIYRKWVTLKSSALC